MADTSSFLGGVSNMGDGTFNNGASQVPVEEMDPDTLREEVLYLNRKVRYMQSISTIFRQKIAMIMREMSKNPASAGDYERIYAKVLKDMQSVETGGGPMRGGAPSTVAAGDHGSGALNDQASFWKQQYEAVQARLDKLDEERLSGGNTSTAAKNQQEDIRRAHQLCLVLQEKAELKQREVQYRNDYDTLNVKFNELNVRHKRLMELQLGCAPEALRDHFKERETELEKELESMRVEVERVKADAKAEVEKFDASVIKKQMTNIKGKYNRAKEELQREKRRRAGDVTKFQTSLEELTDALGRAKKNSEHKTQLVKLLAEEKESLKTKELQQQQASDGYAARVAELEKELVQLSDTSDALVREKQAEANEMLTHVAEKREELTAMQEEVVRSQQLLRTRTDALRDAEIEVEDLRRQVRYLEGVQKGHEEMEREETLQKELLEDFQRRINTAVDHIAEQHNLSKLTHQLEVIHHDLTHLEGVELQLRHKEDVLAIRDDELVNLRDTLRKLEGSVAAVSAMFLEIPQSIETLELTLIERDEFRKALLQAAKQNEVPDLQRVQGVIELRRLEAISARKELREEGGGSQSMARGGSEGRDERSHSPRNTHLDLASAAIGVLQDDDDDDDDDVIAGMTASLSPNKLPHTPEAVEVLLQTSDVSGTEGRSSKSRGSAGPSTKVMEEDAFLTFNLFDSEGTGTLDAEKIRLCLTTLGLPSRLVQSDNVRMDRESFIAFVSKASSI